MTDCLMTKEPATVYRVGRRRFFTKQSAVRALARDWIRRRCDCERGKLDDETGWYPPQCKYHADPVRHSALMKRLMQLVPKYAKTEWP